MKPQIQGFDCYTGEHVNREMTDTEHEEWLAKIAERAAWSPIDEETDETPSET
jgi:hypothetical protein